jgi:hypothetical protein
VSKPKKNPKFIRPNGRPSKYSKERADKIINAIRGGAYVETAVLFANVDKKTFYGWLKKNTEFRNAVELAMASIEIEVMQRIRKRGEQGNQNADSWFMERRFSHRWGHKQRIHMADEAEPTEEENLHEKIVASIAKRNKEKGIEE